MKFVQWRRTAWRRFFAGAAFVAGLSGCAPTEQRAHFAAQKRIWNQQTSSQDHGPTNEPFLDEHVLHRERLIAEVLNRNPSLDSARQAWGEALARYPQVTAFSDPSLAYQTAPGSILSPHGFGQMIQLKQRFEWPGKQALRGAIALAEADAKEADIERVKLHLRTTASLLYDNYFAKGLALQINQAHQKLVTKLRQSAEAQYVAGRADQQDPLSADVELALIEQERVRLSAELQVTAAQLNGLLHRPADAQLPPPPLTLEVATVPERSLQEWRQVAQENRPELHTGSETIRARQNDVKLAKKAYFPDFSVNGTYNSMWPQLEHQLMVGFSLNIPIQLVARRGRQSQANTALARAELELRESQITVDVEVQEAITRFNESVLQVGVYQQKILPSARRQIEAAEAAYTSGRSSFSSIMTAQRRLRTFERAYADALAETWRRRALLARSVGLATINQNNGSLQ